MPSANQRISEYVLEERIGGGAFGEVWRARHHVWSDQQVAIKIPTDPQYIRNLQREGAAIHGLVHPNIVRAMGFDPYADPPYLVMEYVPGTSLRPPIVQKSLKIAEAVAVMRQILAGLAHAHRNGLIHRDIKPENVLINSGRAAKEGFEAEGVVKITDFGLGQVAKVSAESIALSQSMTGEEGRSIAGTLDYMAPEMRAGVQVDGRADLYACGAILYELLTGERPAGAELPSDLNPAVPKYLDEVFRESYCRLDNRFESADEFLKALSRTSPPPIPAPPPPKLPTQPRQVPPPPRMDGGPKPCPGCRQPVGASDQFCMHCGLQLVAQVRRCPQCGAYPDVSDRFCIFCGQTLAAETVA